MRSLAIGRQVRKKAQGFELRESRSLQYLYALEGAIRGCDWLKIPNKIKQVYKEFALSLQSKKNLRAKKAFNSNG